MKRDSQIPDSYKETSRPRFQTRVSANTQWWWQGGWSCGGLVVAQLVDWWWIGCGEVKGVGSRVVVMVEWGSDEW